MLSADYLASLGFLPCAKAVPRCLHCPYHFELHLHGGHLASRTSSHFAAPVVSARFKTVQAMQPDRLGQLFVNLNNSPRPIEAQLCMYPDWCLKRPKVFAYIQD